MVRVSVPLFLFLFSHHFSWASFPSMAGTITDNYLRDKDMCRVSTEPVNYASLSPAYVAHHIWSPQSQFLNHYDDE